VTEATRSPRTSARFPKQGLSRPETKQGRLQRACLDLLGEHEADGALPTSGQFLWYELVQRGVVVKTEGRARGGRTAKQDVTDALTHLRQQRLVPWSWIVDETRALSDWAYAPTVLGYLRSAAEQARIDCWAGVPPPLLLCESRSLAGVLEPLAADYLVSIAATNGQVGGFLHTDITPLLTDGRRVLYLGDWDWQGQQIEANTPRVFAEYALPAWERLALTGEQVEAHDLTGLTIEKADRRYRPPLVYPAVETEALSQRLIVEIVRARLEELLPVPLEVVRRQEADEQQEVRRLLEQTGEDGQP
jgi:hypothetical protein